MNDLDLVSSQFIKPPYLLDLFSESLRPKTCPGVPLGPPPPLSDYIDDAAGDDDDGDNDGTKMEEGTERKRTIRLVPKIILVKWLLSV